MSTPEFKHQFDVNAAEIAKGLPSNCLVLHIYSDGFEESCDVCGQDISNKEMERNAGICDNCAIKPKGE